MILMAGTVGVIDYVYWDDLVNLIYLVDHVLDHCSGLDELRGLALPAGCPGCRVSPVGPCLGRLLPWLRMGVALAGMVCRLPVCLLAG